MKHASFIQSEGKKLIVYFKDERYFLSWTDAFPLAMIFLLISKTQYPSLHRGNFSFGKGKRPFVVLLLMKERNFNRVENENEVSSEESRKSVLLKTKEQPSTSLETLSTKFSQFKREGVPVVLFKKSSDFLFFSLSFSRKGTMCLSSRRKKRRNSVSSVKKMLLQLRNENTFVPFWWENLLNFLETRNEKFPPWTMKRISFHLRKEKNFGKRRLTFRYWKHLESVPFIFKACEKSWFFSLLIILD